MDARQGHATESLEGGIPGKGPAPARDPVACFPLWAELDPPKGADLEGFVSSAEALAEHGLRVVVTDCSSAIMRMTPLWPAHALKEAGISPTVVLGGRDRNRLSFQGDLLALAAMGVQEVLVTRGTPLAQGDQHLAATAGDLDLPLMLDCVARLGSGVDLSGAPLGAPCVLRVGAVIEPTDDPAENERRAAGLGRLAELGAHWVVLGPTYDVSLVELFAAAALRAGVPLVASLLWLRSLSLIRYWNRLPGVAPIPGPILDLMLKARGHPEQALACALDLLSALRERCAGVLLSAPGWEEPLPLLLEGMRRADHD